MTYVYADANSPFVLTPGHFLNRNTATGLQTTSTADDDEEFIPNPPSSAAKLVQRWTKQQQHLDQMWKVWQDDYLMALRQRPIHQSNSSSKSMDKRLPCVGEVVVIRDANSKLPRSTWQLGRVIECCPSHDGKIRTVRLKTATNRELCRPLNFVFPLELPPDLNSDLPSQQPTPSSPGPAHTPEPVCRPQRRPAKVAAERISGWLKEEAVSLVFELCSGECRGDATL